MFRDGSRSIARLVEIVLDKDGACTSGVINGIGNIRGQNVLLLVDVTEAPVLRTKISLHSRNGNCGDGLDLRRTRW